MGAIAPKLWGPELILELPGGETLQYYTKGIDVPAHFVSMSINDLGHNYSIEELCNALNDSLWAAKIEDVFVQYMHHPSHRKESKQPTRLVLFVVKLFDFEDPQQFPNLPTIDIPRYDSGTDTTITHTYAYRDAINPSAAIQRQKGWVALPGKELRVLFRNHPNWCSICRTKASEFHERRQCPHFTCDDCGRTGHYKGSKACKDPFKPRAKANTPLTGNVVTRIASASYSVSREEERQQVQAQIEAGEKQAELKKIG